MKTTGIKSYEEIREQVLLALPDCSPEVFAKAIAKAYASQFVREAAEIATEDQHSSTASSILSLLKVIEND